MEKNGQREEEEEEFEAERGKGESWRRIGGRTPSGREMSPTKTDVARTHETHCYITVL